jgi:hypothetical protein
MPRWRFGESQTDGEVWLAKPSRIPIYVEYEAKGESGTPTWRRILVGTRAWLGEQLEAPASDGTPPKWAALPQMVVVMDGSPDELRRTIDAFIATGIADHYSTPV